MFLRSTAWTMFLGSTAHSVPLLRISRSLFDSRARQTLSTSSTSFVSLPSLYSLHTAQTHISACLSNTQFPLSKIYIPLSSLKPLSTSFVLSVTCLLSLISFPDWFLYLCHICLQSVLPHHTKSIPFFTSWSSHLLDSSTCLTQSIHTFVSH